MVQNLLSPVWRGLVFGLLIGMAFLIPVQALSEQDEAKKSDKTSPSAVKQEAPKLPSKDPEVEFHEVKTPFGIMRVPKSTVLDTASQQSPASHQQAPPSSEEAGAPEDSGVGLVSIDGTAQEAGKSQPEPSQSQPSVDVQATASQSREEESIRFSCVECDLLEFVRNVASELKLNYTLDPDIQGIVNIHTYGEMKRSELMSVLEIVLQINGAAIAKTGAIYRILPSQNAKQLPLAIRQNSQPLDSPVGRDRVLQIVPMNFVSAADMSELLTPYLSDGGDITFHNDANFLIITDTPSNLGKLLELIRIFDADVFGDKRVRMYSIKNSRATSLSGELEQIFSGYSSGSEQSAIKFIPIARLNSVLVISSGSASFDEVDRWISKLDQAGRSQEIRNYFLKIQNGDAKDIEDLLLQIYGSRQQVTFLQPSGSESETAEVGAEELLGGGKQFVQGEIKVVADQVNNALIIQCNPQDFEVIKETVRELDRVPRQVLINVKIYEVVLSDELSMGISAFLQSRNKPLVPSPSATTATFSSSASGLAAAGLNIATKALMGNTRELVAFLNAEETRSRSRVLSAPSVIASDNVTATVQVGTQIPLLTSQGVVPGGTGGGSLFSNTIQNRSTGVILSVKPRINDGGWVTLEVQQEVSSPGPPPAGTTINSPSINMRSVNTQVTVKDGQTIAIGGIISETKGLSKNRVPFLGKIPVVGLLFGNTSKSTTRTELIALITPHVIEDIEKATYVTEELKSTLKELKKVLRKTEI